MPDGAKLARPERQWRAAITLGWPMAIGATTALMSFEGSSLCAFRHLSGQPCPLCGATHACAALLNGDMAAAWQANPGILPVLVIAMAHTTTLALEALTGRRVASNRLWTGAWSGALTLLIGAWILRLLGVLAAP